MKKCLYFSLLLLLPLLVSISISKDASAYDYDYAQTLEMHAGYIDYFDSSLSASELTLSNHTLLNNQLRFSFNGNNNRSVSLRNFYVYHDTSDADNFIPANSIVHFSIHFSGQSTVDGFTYNNLWSTSNTPSSVLNHFCSITSDRVISSSNISREAVCDFWIYTTTRTAGVGVSGSVYAVQPVNVDLPRYLDYVHLKDSLTSSDLDRLSSDITSALSSLELTVQNSSGLTSSQVQSAVNAAIASSGIVDAQQETTNAIKNQTKQEKDQYEQEKEEEAEREEQGKEDADSLGSTFNFQVRNPFVGIFGLFATPSQCVNIPTVASWLHSSSSTYCAWFPSSVRNVLTPVISIAASMLLFGFIVRGFLRKGNFSGGIEV